MKLSKKSWHYRLNLLYVDEHYDIPRNLCPYFWRTVWYTLALIPALILSIPTLIIIAFTKEKWDGLVKAAGIGTLVITALSIVISMVAMWWFFPAKEDDGLGAVLIIFGGVGWTILLIAAMIKISDWTKERNQKREPGLIISFLKAKKEKLCPKIEWEEEDGVQV